MDNALRILMDGLIDYAGLFPPATLEMHAAVRNHAAYRKSGEAAWLGRFVLPASRLSEFADTVNALGPDASDSSSEKPWKLSALIVNDLAGELGTIAAFNERGPSLARPSAVDTLEMKTTKADAIRSAMGRMPRAVTAYFEIPSGEDPTPLLAAIAGSGGRAKVRTGGVTPEQIPSPEALARFIAACARAKVPFKATAGLHHPVRALRRLTYAPDSPEAVMHGFLNVFLAAAFARNGMDEKTLAALLREESPQAFSFREGKAAWRDYRLDGDRLSEARREFALAFGSCSFEEPIQDLGEMRFT